VIAEILRRTGTTSLQEALKSARDAAARTREASAQELQPCANRAGTARTLRDQELAYQLSLVLENLYLVHGALHRNS